MNSYKNFLFSRDNYEQINIFTKNKLSVEIDGLGYGDIFIANNYLGKFKILVANELINWLN